MRQNIHWHIERKNFVKSSLIGLLLLLLVFTGLIFVSGIKNLLAAESGLSASFSWGGQGDGTVDAVLKNNSYGPGKTAPLKYHVYWCTKGKSVGAIACSPSLSGDKKSKETLLFENIDTKIPNQGQTQNITFPNLSKLADKTCGRFQADLSIPNAPFIGGKIFVIGKDCPEPKPKPTPKPSVSPSPSVTPSPGANQQPECVSLSASPTLGGAQLNVTFTGKGRDLDGIIREMNFNFGDGASVNRSVDGETNKDTEVTLSHLYTSSGTYTASLRVKDNSGQSNEWSNTPESCKVTIEVEGEVAAATAQIDQTPPPKVMPATGNSELMTLGYLLSGGFGLWLRQRVKKHFRKSGVIYKYH